jgi:hypothetical protein
MQEKENMPRKVFNGRRRGAKNHPPEALPLADALKVLESRAAQSVPVTAKILGTTEGAVRRDINAGRLQSFNMGRLKFVPSIVIRQRIVPQAQAVSCEAVGDNL